MFFILIANNFGLFKAPKVNSKWQYFITQENTAPSNDNLNFVFKLNYSWKDNCMCIIKIFTTVLYSAIKYILEIFFLTLKCPFQRRKYFINIEKKPLTIPCCIGVIYLFTEVICFHTILLQCPSATYLPNIWFSMW